MANLFIQIDKPFYIAGDTVNGCVLLNLFENVNANEVYIKFKGWESVRWFEERIVSEQERQHIAPHLIYQQVPSPPPRCSACAWTPPTPKTTPGSKPGPSSST